MMNQTIIAPVAHGHLCPDCGLDYDCVVALCEYDVHVPCATCEEADAFDFESADYSDLDEILLRLST